MCCRDLCYLFCCPPFPSAIVSKLAFMPPESSYNITEQNKLQLIEGRAEWPHDPSLLENCVQMHVTRSRRRNKVSCIMVRPVSDPLFTILFSHGNAVDIGQMSSFFYGLGYRLNCNVFGYDYSGYGCSSGKPSEKNLYADITAAFELLTKDLGVPPEKVILYGQSIGTVPSVDLASRQHVAALILHSPLMSGMRVAFPGTQRTWCCDAFPSIEKVPRVKVPTLVIHGTDDEVIDFSHGVSIYERCPTSVEPLWIAGAGHNDVELHAAYLERLRNFLEHETHSSAPAGSSSTPTPTDHLTANNSAR
ncbi:hypothetical protein WR25_23957 isoform B [Diploscapter pachys]|uniref:palmitoyl-protein hydrolase n=1 Tax=Diploscapter pachys TaxID=2018661 RepID=A0A2A2LAD0_9BILA|nr:hypothetical protein WR25_23957 isoform B [Diploscapter pachys]